ncbi:hypothetical protein [Sporosarcina highlanderae]|uniref:Uncharacterized protein n=1 Tax=Sporosarcina highlanderae TaxID=3035916 RepID=A0ABT8JTZ8_9BACL|nr:hypothetical protein [Sporosarcina highlanderae]MDN4608628.1 hypothetical protein [Sporosarcina highlanderae]
MLQTAEICEVVLPECSLFFRKVTIIPNVELIVYEAANEAVLRINDADVIEFRWNSEAVAMFAGIDTVEPIELLEMLARLDLNNGKGAA